jgi:DNA-binding response OmpR family regulator
VKRILVAEDEPAIANLIAYTLEGEGAEAEIALDGRTALAALARLAPDLLSLDLLLPLASGWQILRQLRASTDERLRALPVIVVTALASAKLRAELAELGVRSVIGKPFRLAELRLAAVEAISVPPAPRPARAPRPRPREETLP